MSNLILCKSLQVLQKLATKTTSSRMLDASISSFECQNVCICFTSCSGERKSELRNALRQSKHVSTLWRCCEFCMETPSVLVLQTAIKSELLTNQQAESIAAGAASVLQLLNRADVDALISSPVEVVAFCDEEGLR